MARSRYGAPTGHLEILAIPSVSEWSAAARDQFTYSDDPTIAETRIGGVPLAEIRRRARQRIQELALSAGASVGPVVMTGHQPELFHAGVWIKSFATALLAERVGATPVHVIIDNDTLKSTSIRVPAGAPGDVLLGNVPFDRWEAEIPFEERRVLDEKVFAEFPDRVRATVKPFSFEPVVSDYWRHVQEAGRSTNNLGRRLALGRRRFEEELGWKNVDIYLSDLVDSAAFTPIVAELLVHSDSFRRDYNESIADFRRTYKVRSAHHPAADLSTDGDFVETPLWIWHPDQPHRKPLFVRRDGSSLELRCGDQIVRRMEVDESRDEFGLGEQILSAQDGWKIRPRALVTTLFLRLVCSDWFIHGIGGGKYDEVTDTIIARRFGIRPPRFAVLSASLLLPGAQVDELAGAIRETKRAIRERTWKPDVHVDDALRERDPVASAIERKYELQATKSADQDWTSHDWNEFRQLNATLRPYIETQKQQLEALLARLLEQQRSEQTYSSREYAFCLHPRESLTQLFERFSEQLGSAD